jgi:hypothetical protein
MHKTDRTAITPEKRLSRMRESFERSKNITADDYEYFTTPRVPMPRSKAARKSAERSERQSPKLSEKPSSDRSGD